jgi:hypothetical protein
VKWSSCHLRGPNRYVFENSLVYDEFLLLFLVPLSSCNLTLSTDIIYLLKLLRATLHLEVGPIRCVRGLKSSLVMGQKVEIGPNPFTPKGQVDLVV